MNSAGTIAWVLPLAGALLGLLVGSFLNVVILRLPPRMEFDWRRQAREVLGLAIDPAEAQPPGVALGRSHCPHCGHLIRAHENIPVLSWLFLRGRCSACANGISVRYPLVELLTAVLFAITVWHFGLTLQCAAALLLTALLVALAGIDLDTQYLPDSLTLPLLWIGLLLSVPAVFTDPVSSILGAALGYGFFWTVFQIFRLLTGKEGMGFGDFKLLAALGAWLGYQALPLLVLMASLVGALVGGCLVLLKRHGREQPMPFGPFIAAAGWICLVWGDQLVSAYLQFSGLR